MITFLSLVLHVVISPFKTDTRPTLMDDFLNRTQSTAQELKWTAINAATAGFEALGGLNYEDRHHFGYAWSSAP